MSTEPLHRVHAASASVAQTVDVVVEELCLAVAAADREAFLRADEQVWTAFLQTCPGFVRKEVWVDPDRPDELRAVIWWESLELWQAVTPERVAEVDLEMGDLVRPVLWVRAPEVVRSSPIGP